MFYFDDYSRIKKIGEGGYGRVYLCTNNDTGLEFALKEVYVGEEKHLKALKLICSKRLITKIL